MKLALIGGGVYDGVPPLDGARLTARTTGERERELLAAWASSSV